MSSPCGQAEPHTALLSSLQKSLAYLRLVIMFPLRLLFCTLNDCLSSALSSWPCYFQFEWHMHGWFCLLRSLSALFKFFVVLVCLVSLGLSPLGLGFFWSVLPWNELCCAELFLDWEEPQDYFMSSAWHSCLCAPVQLWILLAWYCLFMSAFLCTVSQPVVCSPYGISSRLYFPNLLIKTLYRTEVKASLK